jgi:hypothetical protein
MSMDGILSEICRARTGEPIRGEVLRRWQSHLRDVIAPQLDEIEYLRACVATLTAELADRPTLPAKAKVAKVKSTKLTAPLRAAEGG